MKYKISELEGKLLDTAVATALGYQTIADIPIDVTGMEYNPCGNLPLPWRPSGIWDQGGPVIERESIDLRRYNEGTWMAEVSRPCKPGCGLQSGHTPLVAAMRAFVFARYGEAVEL